MEPEFISDNLTLLLLLLLLLNLPPRLLLQRLAVPAALLFLRISVEQRRGIIPFSCASTILLSIYFPPFFLLPRCCSLTHQEIPTNSRGSPLSPFAASRSHPRSVPFRAVLPFPRTFFATSNLRLRKISLSPSTQLPPSLFFLASLRHSCSFFRSDTFLLPPSLSLPNLALPVHSFRPAFTQPLPPHPPSFFIVSLVSLVLYEPASFFLSFFLSFLLFGRLLSSSTVVIIKHCEASAPVCASNKRFISARASCPGYSPFVALSSRLANRQDRPEYALEKGKPVQGGRMLPRISG